MRKTLLALLAAALLSCLAGVSCGTGRTKNPPGIPISFSEMGLPVVQVMIGGAELPFVLDTGANCSLIDAPAAGSLRLPALCPNTSHTTALLGATVKLTHVHDVPCMIGGVGFVLKTLEIGDFPGRDAHGIRGLLGMDFLQTAHAVIDVGGRRLLVRPGAGKNGRTEGGT